MAQSPVGSFVSDRAISTADLVVLTSAMVKTTQRLAKWS